MSVSDEGKPRGYSEDELFTKLDEHESTIAGYKDIIQSERLSKSELLKKTGIAAFISKRVVEEGVKQHYHGFWFDESGDLCGDILYPLYSIQ